MTNWLGHGELGTPTEWADVVQVEPRFIEVWAAIVQLQSMVDALKAQAAPTPEPSAEPSEELRLLRELARAGRTLVRVVAVLNKHAYQAIPFEVLEAIDGIATEADALAALDAAEGEGTL